MQIEPEIPTQLIELLRSAQAITVLTGAGISAESGIPTFRDAQTGLWAKYSATELATPHAFQTDPNLVMDWYRWRWQLVQRSAPNAGHYALAAMEQRAPRFTLITQNVDGLHRAAGSQNVIELHGSLARLRCSDPACPAQARGWMDDPLPTCDQCGALLRPDIVWFGEMLAPTALEAALQASRSCDVFFSIGTSGVVEPAATLPYEALRGGAQLVEINPHPTPLSVHARFCYAQTAGSILPQLLAATWD